MKAALASLLTAFAVKIAGRKRLNGVMTFGKRFSALRRRMRENATRGSAAIEFAFVAPVFFGLLFAIIETGIMYFSQFALQDAVVQAARVIRTGQTVNLAGPHCDGGSGNYTSTTWFAGQVCCGISSLLSCSNLHVAVTDSSSGFGGTGFTNNQVGGLYVAATNSYPASINACDVVLVRATYTWTVATPILSFFLVNMAGSAHLLASTLAFRNEPYGASTC